MRALTTVLIGWILLGGIISFSLKAQTSSREPDINHRLEMIEKGQGEAVRAELPALMTNFQNNPGLLYLQAVLTTDGTEAAKLYQNVVDNFPKNEWSDDALYRLYQYYFSIGLYKTADQKLTQLKEEYPFSAYAAEQNPVLAENPAGEEKPSAKEKPAVKEKPVIKEKPPVKEILAAKEPPMVKETPIVEPPKGPVQKFATNFTIQVGAFSTLQNADELRARFEKEGYTSNIFTIVTQGKKLHKVWVGEFQTLEDAKKFAAEVKSKFNLASMVVSR